MASGIADPEKEFTIPAMDGLLNTVLVFCLLSGRNLPVFSGAEEKALEWLDCLAWR